MLSIDKLESLLNNLLELRSTSSKFNSANCHIFTNFSYFEILGSTGFDSKFNNYVSKSSIENELVNIIFKI